MFFGSLTMLLKLQNVKATTSQHMLAVCRRLSIVLLASPLPFLLHTYPAFQFSVPIIHDYLQELEWIEGSNFR